jgi:alpha/beta superfamily hydrolase
MAPSQRDRPGGVRTVVAVGDDQARVRAHRAEQPVAGIVMVGGARNEVDGPSGVYGAIAERLRPVGVTGLRLSFRQPGEFGPCLDDVLAALDALARQGARRLAVLGWSFGGAVAIAAGARHPGVVGVAAVASQAADAGEVGELAPRSLLLLHGTSDRVLPSACSRQLYAMAREPKFLVLYERDDHALSANAPNVVHEVARWAVPLLVEPQMPSTARSSRSLARRGNSASAA